jgi:hypothetical protein
MLGDLPGTGRTMQSWPLGFAAGVVLFGLAGPTPAFPAWETYQNTEYHYSMQYPRELFEGSAPDNGGITLYTPDRRALLFIFGGHNQKAEDAGELASGLANLPDIYRVTYRRVAEDWFVLSGYLSPSGDIFYERVELSPSGRFLSGFRLEYPVSQRWKFDHLIGRMGKSLTAPSLR